MILTLGFAVIFSALFAFSFYFLNQINNELREHTKRRHKHYSKKKMAIEVTNQIDLGNIDDTPIDEIKVGGTD